MSNAMANALRGILDWYAKLPEPGLVPMPVELSARLREAKAALVALYCPRCNRHHEREGEAEEKCQAETQFARADHRRRGGVE